MRIFRPRTLQRRLALLVLLPVAVALLGIGVLGFIYARSAIVTEWSEAVSLKLQRAAHQMDMRVGRTKEWMAVFQNTSWVMGAPHIQEWLLGQIDALPGVTGVNLIWGGEDAGGGGAGVPGHHMGGGMAGEMAAPAVEVRPPRYDYRAGQEVFTLVSSLVDGSGSPVGRLEVTMRFDYLMEDIIASGWAQSDEACLVDRDGLFLSHSAQFSRDRHALGDSGDPLEAKILAAMTEKTSGTVWSPGRPLRPPRWIVGFHRLHEVPWSILLFAKGEQILDPLITFRNYYAGALAICIGIILLLIRSVVGKMVHAITTISEAARKIARGQYARIAPGKGEDEIAQLGRSFNTMVEGLEERDFMADTFGRYVDPEIARELLRRPEAARLGGEKREVAILISDLRGFTPLSESLSPEATIQLLNRHFSSMIQVIQKHRGIIVDFFGDSVLAFFDPLEGPLQDAVRRAVRCGLEMQEAMDRVNERNRKDDLPQVEMGVGLHAGEVIVGNIGSETRAKYGIVGSAVNLTHRIQQLAAAGEIVVSERVVQEAGPLICTGKVLKERLKGVQEPVKMYVVGGLNSRPSAMGKEV